MNITRRQLMAVVGAGGAAAMATGAGAVGAMSTQTYLGAKGNGGRQSTGDVLRSNNGVLRVQLAANLGTVIVNKEPTPGLTTYNGLFPAPTLIVKPGDRLEIRLINNGGTATNLHFHGMHVSPRGHQDNVFIEVEPGEVHEYDVRIPPDHPGGLFWYHPHHHTTTGPQVWSGLSGLLVVEGGAASRPEIRGLRRRRIALREGGVDSSGFWADYTTLTPDETQLYVNGRLNPRMNIRPGETQFWQIGNIGVATYYLLQLDDHEFTVVEEDGSPVWKTWQTPTLFLSPGKRYGVLVTARKQRGTVRLRQLGYDQGKAQWPERELMRLRIDGKPGKSVSVDRNFGSPPAWLDDPIAQRRVLTLSQNVVDGAGEFYIDGVMFDNLTFNDVIQVKLGTTEEWVIRNASSKSSGGPENEEHPFHIHVNDFVVVEQGSWDPVTNEVSNRQFIDPRSQADTVNVPWNAYVRFRTHFVDFIGRSVYHCHLLFHEDHGMMGIFDIVNADGEGAGPGQRLPTHQH